MLRNSAILTSSVLLTRSVIPPALCCWHVQLYHQFCATDTFSYTISSVLLTRSVLPPVLCYWHVQFYHQFCAIDTFSYTTSSVLLTRSVMPPVLCYWHVQFYHQFCAIDTFSYTTSSLLLTRSVIPPVLCFDTFSYTTSPCHWRVQFYHQLRPSNQFSLTKQFRPNAEGMLLSLLGQWAFLSSTVIFFSFSFLMYVMWVRVDGEYVRVCFNDINGSGPAYLSELLHVYTPSRTLRSSFDTRMLKIQQYKRKTHGFRTFSCFGPHIWNSLPQDFKHCSTLSSFKAKLKTFLFSQYFRLN